MCVSVSVLSMFTSIFSLSLPSLLPELPELPELWRDVPSSSSSSSTHSQNTYAPSPRPVTRRCVRLCDALFVRRSCAETRRESRASGAVSQPNPPPRHCHLPPHPIRYS
ncbi:hypothetical protein DFP73DRAFT_261559 [Morchella snyderi]|nr:hypothetical protein DFP73DRAFT_261559 [Morchella snyderi]